MPIEPYDTFEGHMKKIVDMYLCESKRDLDAIRNVNGETLLERQEEDSTHIYHSLKFMKDFMLQPTEEEMAEMHALTEIHECGECGNQVEADATSCHHCDGV